MVYRLIWLENVGCVDMQTNVGVLYMLTKVASNNSSFLQLKKPCPS